jgi:hypothetical protein
MVKQFFVGFLLGVILYLAMLLANTAEAREWHLVELHDVTITGKKFFPKGRNPLINGNELPNREPAEEVDLNLNMDVAGVAYWENMVHSMTDNDTTTGKGQFRVVGLNFRWGYMLQIGWTCNMSTTLSTYLIPRSLPASQ